ncbi:MAG: ATP-binding protein [Nitrospinota bacterium]|nr:ATP-binding protein [Nitrospinota bacterium]
MERLFQAIALALVLMPQAALAAPVLEITDSQGRYPMGYHFDYLEDVKGAGAIEEMLKSPTADKFRPLDVEMPNFGFSRSAFWFRAKVTNTSGLPQPLLLEQFSAWIDLIDLYIIRDDGTIEKKSGGDMYPFSQREIVHPRFHFKLGLDTGQAVELYIRVQSDDPLELPFTLWKQEDFLAYNQGQVQYYGIVYGALMAVLLYNLFLFFSLADKSYLFYVLYTLSLILMIFAYTGSSFQYFWPGSPRFQDWVVFPAGFLSMLMGIFFTKSFLDTKKKMPRAHMFLTAMQLFYVLTPLVGTVLGLTHYISQASVMSAMLFPVIQVTIGVMAYRRHIPAARFFILAWSFSLVGTIHTMVTAMGLLPYGVVMRHSFEIGFLMDAIVLSFALADKIKILREEKESAEAQAHHVLEVSKRELEDRVAERTVELVTAKDRAEAATELKDKFVGLVSHDLRSPLSGVLASLRLVNSGQLGQPISQAKTSALLQQSEATCKGLMGLIEDLLGMSRISSGSLRPVKHFLDARQIAEAELVNIRQAAELKGIDIRNDLPERMALLADRQLIGTVLRNLLTNSVKFTPRGGEISIFSPDANGARLAVRDSGVGIDKERLEDIFKSHVKTSTFGTAGETGSGFGLPFSMDIMKAHEGTISVWSEPGKGSVFTLELPERQALVLLVDEERESRQLMMDYLLAGTGGKVRFAEAENGVFALETLKGPLPSLIITDVEMNGMDGFRLLAEIQRDQSLGSIPVIVAASASDGHSGDGNLRRKVFDLGASDYVVKPIEPGDFVPRAIRFL